MMGAEAAVTLLLGLLDRAAAVSAVIKQAKAENRDPTALEWESLIAEDDAARMALVDAIKAAKGI